MKHLDSSWERRKQAFMSESNRDQADKTKTSDFILEERFARLGASRKIAGSLARYINERRN